MQKINKPFLALWLDLPDSVPLVLSLSPGADKVSKLVFLVESVGVIR